MATLEKTIREQSTETLVETVNGFKAIEELVRMGLMPVTELPYLKRAFVQMESGAFMPSPERRSFYSFIQKLLEMSLSDPTILRQIKNKTAATKNESHDPLPAYTDTVHPNTLPPVMTIDPSPDMPEGCCGSCGSVKRAIAGLAGHHCLTCDKAHLATAVRDFAKYPVGHYEESVNEAKELSPRASVMRMALKTVHASKPGHTDSAKTVARRKMAQDANKDTDGGMEFQSTTRRKGKLVNKKEFRKEETEVVDEAIDLKKTPPGMLQTLANIVKQKKRAGGKPTPEDKKMATRAKNELRRRRHMGEEVEQIAEAPHPITKKEWNSKHKDHKHTIGRNKYLMVLDKKTGGTMLKPVQVTESYKQAVEIALAEYGVSSITELGDRTKEFFAVVEAAIEPRKVSTQDDDMKARVKADMEKRKAAKEKAMADAKTELDNTDKKELKKSYIKHAFKKEND